MDFMWTSCRLHVDFMFLKEMSLMVFKFLFSCLWREGGSRVQIFVRSMFVILILCLYCANITTKIVLHRHL